MSRRMKNKSEARKALEPVERVAPSAPGVPSALGARAGAELPASFFDRDARLVARELIGAQLCRTLPDGTIARWPITETEAYTGPEDGACHAHLNRRTKRTAVMFGEPGTHYVYLCYGIHWLLNLVVGPVGYPAAVLVRGAGDQDGPGKLTKALGITGALNGLPATPATGLWVAAGEAVSEAEVQATPRIGIAYAGEPWVSQPWRFVREPSRHRPPRRSRPRA